MIFNLEQDYYASFNANNRAIIIYTSSIANLIVLDFKYSPYIFNLDASNDVLGRTILQALEHSRTIDEQERDAIYFPWEKYKQHHEDWLAHLCKALGCKTKRTLLKDMMHCSVWLKNGRITISPTRHVKLEAYDGLPDDEDVILSLDNTHEEIGAGLRLALSRCHGPGRMRDKLLKKPSS